MVAMGSVVGGYRIERVLGSRGMGAAYLAADPALPRHLALKVLSAELSCDPDFRIQLRRPLA
jgi:eukaryotic-like serine/threonine-protein kinase